jgi:hypothetical protein
MQFCDVLFLYAGEYTPSFVEMWLQATERFSASLSRAPYLRTHIETTYTTDHPISAIHPPVHSTLEYYISICQTRGSCVYSLPQEEEEGALLVRWSPSSSSCGGESYTHHEDASHSPPPRPDEASVVVLLACGSSWTAPLLQQQQQLRQHRLWLCACHMWTSIQSKSTIPTPAA